MGTWDKFDGGSVGDAMDVGVGITMEITYEEAEAVWSAEWPDAGKGRVHLHTDFSVWAKEKKQLFHRLKLLASFDDDEEVQLMQGGRREN